ncbi:alpha/beta hydrolase family protein [Candidatus Dependentiae bacterium]
MKYRSVKILLVLFCFWGSIKVKALTYLFSHGFADTGKQVRRYMKEYETRRGKIKTNAFYIIDGLIKTFNYPDAICKPFSNIFRTSLGQENELQALKQAFCHIQDDEGVVLVGVSRGASAAAIFMGACRPTNIKAVVLISPFAHVLDVFKTNFFYRLFMKISNYSQNGKHPIDWLCRMDKNIPIIFVCAKTDKTVPCESTIRLYKKLVLSGYTNAYLLCLNVGKHAKLLKSKEAEKFQNVIHAFYKKYGLPHKQEFAELGQDFLARCKWCAKDGHIYLERFEKESLQEDQARIFADPLYLAILIKATLRQLACKIHGN